MRIYSRMYVIAGERSPSDQICEVWPGRRLEQRPKEVPLRVERAGVPDSDFIVMGAFTVQAPSVSWPD